MNVNINNQTASFGSKARRFTRRLSYGISKVLRDWNADQRDSMGNLRYHNEEQNPRVFNIDDLLQVTKFSKSEIQFIYRDFKIRCPNGILTEKGLAEIYSHLFSCGDTQLFSKHLFSAMSQQVLSSTNKNYRYKNEINFKEFLMVLSDIMRGSLEDRIKWLFYFYDINKDGRITIDEIESIIRSLYDLMGANVSPPVDEEVKLQHIENVIQKLNDIKSSEVSLGYNEFYKLFSKQAELIEGMMSVY
ncbi:unnamed protein product [Brachionus calyciflorus]|uniref:EF-hand domain-containing protein n=1 Tax=Brachionus calyciflorus TaxID=104777 RepID=A0A813NWP6_9BILA|nr:unnamed protein product [Brachionus calyciflorus]